MLMGLSCCCGNGETWISQSLWLVLALYNLIKAIYFQGFKHHRVWIAGPEQGQAQRFALWAQAKMLAKRVHPKTSATGYSPMELTPATILLDFKGQASPNRRPIRAGTLQFDDQPVIARAGILKQGIAVAVAAIGSPQGGQEVGIAIVVDIAKRDAMPLLQVSESPAVVTSKNPWP